MLSKFNCYKPDPVGLIMNYIVTESGNLVLQKMGMRQAWIAWGPPTIAQSACTIAKWVVIVLFTTANTKIHEKRSCLLFLTCMQSLP